MKKQEYLKSDKGITLMVLIITLVIMLILMVTATVNIHDYAERKHRGYLSDDIIKLREEIDYYYSENKELPISNRYINTEALENIQEAGVISQNDNDYYYVIDLSLMRELELELGKDYYTIENKSDEIDDLLDVYIVNEQSHMIYYPKGVMYQGKMLYTTLEEGDIKIEDISLASIKVEANQEFQVTRHTQLKAHIFPDFVENTGLIYTSSDTSVATIDENGIVYGLKEGTTIITLTSKDDNTITKDYELDVTSLEIKNMTDFTTFKNYINAGNTFEGSSAKLMTDIDLEGTVTNQWTPITRFAGTFDGNNHEIKNLYVDSDTVRFLGFFEILDEAATISNLKIANCNIMNRYIDNGVYAGGISGYNYGTIKNCSVHGTVKAQNNVDKTTCVGGISGINSGVIEECYNNAFVYAEHSSLDTTTTEVFAGGITGYSDKIVANCYNKNKVENNGYKGRIGGICGFIGGANSAITNCYSIGEVTGLEYMGGICGANGSSSVVTGTITNSYCSPYTLYSYYYYNSGSYTESSAEVVLDINALKNYAATLGDKYKNDTNIINNGFPILTWQ